MLLQFISDFVKFHHEVDKFKSILYKNSYPSDLVDKVLKNFRQTVPKKDLAVPLLYLGKLSFQIWKNNEKHKLHNEKQTLLL